VELNAGKKCKTPLTIEAVELFHKQCTTVGYILSTPAKAVQKLRPDLLGASKQETGLNVKAARQRNKDIHVAVQEPEKPHFAFLLDTTIDVLLQEEQAITRVLEKCPVIMIECTYLEESMLQEASARGHICWAELVPFVAKSVQKRKQREGIMHQTWILVHFSLRYMDEQIDEFFRDQEQSKLILDDNETHDMPPDVILWLDSGPKELWVSNVVVE